MWFSIAVFLGVTGVALSPGLLPLTYWWAAIAVSVVGVTVGLFHRKAMASLLFILVVVIAACWATYWGQTQLSRQLSPSLEGRDLILEGRVSSLPEIQYYPPRHNYSSSSMSDVSDVTQRTQDNRSNIKSVRFNFLIQASQRDEGADSPATLPSSKASNLPKLIRLSWYSREGFSVAPDVQINDVWRFRVRLKRPHTARNPGGFDYERWLLAQGLGATGYIKTSKTNHDLASSGHQLVARNDDFSMGFARQFLRDFVLRQEGSLPATSLLVALLIGDQSLIDGDTRQVIQDLGLSHLLAISGLHIGLAASLGFVLGAGIGRVLSIVAPLHVFTPQISVLVGLICAGFYALLAGGSVPTQRAIVMLLVWGCFYCLNRRHSRWLPWWVALAASCVIHPLAIFDGGFWLSFTAVAMLLMLPTRRLQKLSFWGRLGLLFQVQLKLLLALMVVQLGFGFSVSWIAPLINLVAIPYIGLLVVPLLLFTAVVALIGFPFSHDLLSLVFYLTDFFWNCLWQLDNVLQYWGMEKVFQPLIKMSLWLMVLAMSCSLFVISPLSLRLRVLGLAGLWLSLYPMSLKQEGLAVRVFDVGQGLSVLASHDRHHILFDTGPNYAQGRSAATNIILPSLSALGVGHLSAVVVSHRDSDHSGGVKAIDASSINVFSWMGNGDLVLPEGTDRGRSLGQSRCDKTRQWQSMTDQYGALLRRVEGDQKGLARHGVDALGFTLTSFSGEANLWRKSNNRSCVMLLEYQGVRILLPGDIEVGRERALLEDNGFNGRQIDVIVAPHHGSKTSSSSQFIDQLQPRWVVFSAGYRNRYGHPHRDVVARYEQRDVTMMNTATAGMVTIRVTPDGDVTVDSYRQSQPRYWGSPL